jgi:hypothetical protein
MKEYLQTVKYSLSNVFSYPDLYAGNLNPCGRMTQTVPDVWLTKIYHPGYFLHPANYS